MGWPWGAAGGEVGVAVVGGCGGEGGAVVCMSVCVPWKCALVTQLHTIPLSHPSTHPPSLSLPLTSYPSHPLSSASSPSLPIRSKHVATAASIKS